MNTPAVSPQTGLNGRAKHLFGLYAPGRARNLSPSQRGAAFFRAAVKPIANISLWGWIAFCLAYDAVTLWPATAFCAGFQITFIGPWIARRSRFGAEVFATVMVAVLFISLMWMLGKTSGLTYALLPAALILILETGPRRLAPLLVCVIPLPALFRALPVWFPNTQPFINATPWLLETIQVANNGNLIMIPLMMIVVILRGAEDAGIALASE